MRRDRRKIRSLAQNWEFDRIAKIDLAILRLAIFEMLFRQGHPPMSRSTRPSTCPTVLQRDAKPVHQWHSRPLKGDLGRDRAKASE